MSRSSNRYVPVSMSMPVGIPRTYYITDEAIQDFEEEMEPYTPWVESMTANGDREPNGPGPQTAATTTQWASVTKTQASSTVEATQRERHHIQMHEANPPSDITEIFRRKQEDRYAMPAEVMVGDDNSPRYFYRPPPLSRLPQHQHQHRMNMERDRGIMSAPPIPTGPLLPHHIGYYQHDEHVVQPLHHPYETLVFHSTPQLHRTNMPPKPNIHCTSQLVTDNGNQIPNVLRSNKPPHMKPAVTVRTPRYFRRQGVFKRPSALCLPLSCEPDPAILQQRPIKSRLPTTMPAMHILSPQRQHQLRHMQQMNLSQTDDEHSNTSHSMQTPFIEFLNDVDRNMMSKPPGKLDQSEIERIQQIIEQRTVVKDNQEDTACDEDINSTIEESELKQADMEFILNQYQQMIGMCNQNQNQQQNQMDSKSKCSKTSCKSRKPKSAGSSNKINNIGQMLKPRIPPSLKQKRASKSNLRHEEKSQKEKDKIEIESITSNVLDTLLHDLHKSGIVSEENKCDIELNPSIQNIQRPNTASSARDMDSPSSSRKERGCVENDEISAKTPMLQNIHKNYNFQQDPSSANTQNSAKSSDTQMPENLISYEENLSDSNHYVSHLQQSSSAQATDNSSNIDQVTKNVSTLYNSDQYQEDKMKKSKEYLSDHSSITSNIQQWTNKRPMKYPHDEHTAMELHRSKSYIVNLIDRALSRELGTIPEERTSKEFMSMEARTALDIMSSPAVKNMDNDMCLEITQVLADSISTAPVKEAIIPTSSVCSTPKADCSKGDPNKMTEDLTYNPTSDEPTYIKQLKKLRWGHLKHIQREMRRLEDLEKFLDSCSSDK